MRQLTVTAPRALEWREVPAPGPVTGPAALVRPLAVGRCDFDRLVIDGRIPLPLPIAIGHECVAEVLDTGAAVGSFRPGDRVVVPFQIACGGCSKCVAGLTSNCLRQPWLSCYGLGAAAGNFGGAMSDALLVPFADAMLVKLPDALDPSQAAAAGCNVVDAYRCVVPTLEERPDGDVLIAGGDFGSIALYAVALARAAGAGSVTYLDDDPDRLRRAAGLGARAIDDPSEVESHRFSVTVDASRDADRLATALRATAPDGICTISTMYLEPRTAIPLGDLFQTCATVKTGQPHARAHLEPALELLAAHDLGHSVVASVLGWEEAPSAYVEAPGKVVFVRDDPPEQDTA